MTIRTWVRNYLTDFRLDMRELFSREPKPTPLHSPTVSIEPFKHLGGYSWVLDVAGQRLLLTPDNARDLRAVLDEMPPERFPWWEAKGHADHDHPQNVDAYRECVNAQIDAREHGFATFTARTRPPVYDPNHDKH